MCLFRDIKCAFFKIPDHLEILIINVRALRAYDHSIMKTEKIIFKLFNHPRSYMQIGIENEYCFALGEIDADIPRPAHPGVKAVETIFINPFMIFELFENLAAVENTYHFALNILEVIK